MTNNEGEQVNTYSIYISGNVLIDAPDYETALEQFENSLSEVLTEWEIESAYDENGQDIY